MTPRKRYAFWIDSEQKDGLEQIRERDGILPSEQIRRAIDAWLAKRRVTRKTERKRAVTRQRS